MTIKHNMPQPSPEILFFGCLRKCQMHLHSKLQTLQFWDSPWGDKIDEVLAPPSDGVMVSEKDGWTAVSFLDSSMDTRPGAWCAFLVEKSWPAAKILEEARKQWPEVCDRRGFALNRPKPVTEVW